MNKILVISSICTSLYSLTTLANAMDLKPYQLAMAQPLVLAKHAIVGQWTCQYTQQYENGVQMQTVSVDDYFADGRNSSVTKISIELPQKTIHYQMHSNSDWSLLPGEVLDHQNWHLTQFTVDDAEIEKLLKVRESIEKKTQFKTQIIQVDAQKAVVRGLDDNSAVHQKTTCYR